MIVLGIDTSTNHASIAIGSETDILGEARFAGPRRQDSLIPAIERLLDWTGVRLPQIGGIAVGVGPGLYTGLRVGVEVGKTLAQVLKVPIVGMSSLDILAFGARTTRRLIGAVLDARRGEVFVGLYRSVPGGVIRVGNSRVGRPEAVAADLLATPEDVLLVGNGAILYRQELEEAGPQVAFAPVALSTPLASSLVEVAVPRFIREETDRPADVVPIYLRKTDAEIAWDQRARGASA
jgi:tRNA threonylcarbamoyladenosine biosynthesis protein TsaB